MKLKIKHINDKGYFSLSALLVAFIIFFHLSPFYIWGLTNNSIATLIVNLSLLVTLFFNASLSALRKEPSLVAYFILLILYCILSSYSHITILGVISRLIGIVPLCLMAKKINYTSYKVLQTFYSIIIVISLINFLMVYLGTPLSSRIIDPLNELKEFTYTAYPFLVIPNMIEIPRFYGIFDEPGVVGTYAIMFLTIEKLNFRKWQNWAIFISGIFSLSLFFYLGFFLIYIVNVLREKGSLVKTFVSLGFVAIIGFIFVIQENSVLYESIGSRLQYDEQDRTFSGDNRSVSFLKDRYDKVKWSSPVFYLGGKLGGASDKFVEEINEGGASYRNMILKIGLLGTILYTLFFILYFKRNVAKRFDRFLYLFVIFLVIWQRPYFIDIGYLYFFFTMANTSNFVNTRK